MIMSHATSDDPELLTSVGGPVSSRYFSMPGQPSPRTGKPISPKGKREPLLSISEKRDAEAGGERGAPEAGGEPSETGLEAHLKAAMYGVINAVVVAPVMIGFAAIIFRHPAFHADPTVYGRLVKLVMFSSTVHQISFSTFSSLPFSIGQVQDAGLIFLSKMAGDLADATAHEGADVQLATVLVGLSVSTALLGVALVITGKLRLAMLVQYLPLPVVGGYLAFIGLYCLEAGLTMMSGVQVTSLLGFDCPSQWAALAQPSALLAVMPGVLCGVGMLLVLQRFHHFLVLPSMLLAIPTAFYIVATLCGYDLPALRDAGWVAPQQPPASTLEVFAFFKFGLVRWELLPSIIPTWLGMYVVVAFSSSLDVAAIQMDMGKQLDFNHELVTVGISNALSGLTGGFTGSYIFSQTIFTFRTGTRSRVCGLVVVAMEALLFVAPFSVVAYVPKLFFGAVLTFIAVDLMLDWLYHSRHKVHPAEYLIIWLTFGLINLVGLELGMACGVLAAMLQFILDYARVPVVQRVTLRSNVMRSPMLSSVLASLQPQIIQLRCRGYIFFGSTVQIMDDVLGSVVLPDGAYAASSPSASRPASSPSTPMLSDSQRDSLEPTRFVVFDFTMVNGLDATAARSCFLNLCRTLAPAGIQLVFGGVAAGGAVESLLIGHEILGPNAGASEASRFDTIDEALEFCEEELLRSTSAAQQAAATAAAHPGVPIGLQVPPPTPIKDGMHGGGGMAGGTAGGMAGGMAGGGGIPRAASSAERLTQVLSSLVEPSLSDMMRGLAPFFDERRYVNGQTIFRRDEAAQAIFFIVTGEVTLYEDNDAHHHSTHHHPSAARLGATKAPPSSAAIIGGGSSAVTAPLNPDQAGRRLVRYVNGGIFGELDFFLRNPRSFNAVATSDDCTILLLTRDALQSMQSQASQLAAALEHAVLKYLCFQVNNKLGLSDGIADIRESLQPP